MAYDPTQRVPPPIEPTWYEDLTPPPPPPPPFDPSTLPYFRVMRNKVHWTTILALGTTGLILLLPFIWLLLGKPNW
ncbi:MAG TPA: hypothetical protein VKT82_10550 [Ktedonobacterales bacterium]|nr:hypothetical protein [Ktedonobacterales bacterium]